MTARFFSVAASRATKQVSDVTAHVIDEEIRGLIDTCYGEAKRFSKRITTSSHLMADALMKYETIDEGQIKTFMAGRNPTTGGLGRLPVRAGA